MSEPRPDAPPRRRFAETADGLSRLQRSTYRVWFAVGVVVLLAVSFLLLYRPLAVILAPLLLALLIVYLLDPLVSWLQGHGVPRLVGALLAYLGVVAIFVGGGLALTPAVSAQLQDFARDAPELGEALMVQTEEAADRVGLEFDPETVQVPALAEQAQEFVAEAENRELMLALLGGLSGVARGALFVVVALALGPIIAFYALVDLPNLRRMARALVPPVHRNEAAELAAKLGRVVGGFVRGQLVIALAIGVATSIALAVVGLPYWLLVGVIAGVANIIPLLGPFVAGLLGALIAFVTEGLGFALLVVVVMTAVQQIDGQLMSPLIFGRTVRVHPLAVLLGLLVAGSLFGIFGMLVVVPLMAGVKVVLQHFWYTRVPWAEPASTDGGQGQAPDDGAAGAEPGATDRDNGAAPQPAVARDPDADAPLSPDDGLSGDEPAAARR